MPVNYDNAFVIMNRDGIYEDEWGRDAACDRNEIIRKSDQVCIGHWTVVPGTPPHSIGMWIDETYRGQGMGKWLVENVAACYAQRIVINEWRIISPGARAFFQKMAKLNYVELQP